MKEKLYTVSQDEKFRPFIRMRGKWLKDVGFHVGDRIRVTVEEGKMTLVSIGHSERKSGIINDPFRC